MATNTLVVAPDTTDACDWRETLFEDAISDSFISLTEYTKYSSIHEVKESASFLIEKQAESRLIDFKGTLAIVAGKICKEDGSLFPADTMVNIY